MHKGAQVFETGRLLTAFRGLVAQSHQTSVIALQRIELAPEPPQVKTQGDGLKALKHLMGPASYLIDRCAI